MIELLNYQIIGGFRVVHLLFVAPTLYIIINIMNDIHRLGYDLREKKVATIYDIIGISYSDKLFLLMFETGDTAFIEYPIVIKDLIDLAGVGEIGELKGVSFKYHTNKYNIIEGKSMEIV